MNSDQIKELARLVAEELIKQIEVKQLDAVFTESLGDPYELLVAELARLMTLLSTYEDSEQYEKAAIIKNKIDRLQRQIEFSQARRKNSGADGSFFESGSRSKFKGGLESLGKSNATVSDLYGQLGLTEYEDDFERNLYDDYGAGGMVTGRTCHLCNGQGCARCNQTGMLD